MSKISLKHSGGNVVSLNSPTNAPGAADVAFKLPNADGSDGQAIVTDGSGNLSFGSVAATRNLIINGACLIAQRGVSSTADGYGSVDRFKCNLSGNDENATHEQADVASGTTPYTLGFRKCFKITNGNQTSGAGAGDIVEFGQKIEAQNIANSGWNYTSASSFITLSFWVKSSVAQVFYGYVRTRDGTSYSYPFSTGSLSANTWTKVTKTIPGNSNLQIDNNNGSGFEIYFDPFLGTTYTNDSRSLDSWAVHADGSHFPDMTPTWYTTNDATFEITGVQLEVGSVATDFEHLSFADELSRCERYYQILAKGANKYWGGTACNYTATQLYLPINWKTQMRTTPSLVFTTGTSYYTIYDSGNTGGISFTRPTDLRYNNELGGSLYVGPTYISGLTAGNASLWYSNHSDSLIAVEAEL